MEVTLWDWKMKTGTRGSQFCQLQADHSRWSENNLQPPKALCQQCRRRERCHFNAKTQYNWILYRAACLFLIISNTVRIYRMWISGTKRHHVQKNVKLHVILLSLPDNQNKLSHICNRAIISNTRSCMTLVSACLLIMIR